MANLQIYPCPMQRSCETYACYGVSTYIIARKDLDLGTALSTGTRVCTQCAENLASNIPLELYGTFGDIEARIRTEVEQEFAERLTHAETETAAAASVIADMAGDHFDPMVPAAELVQDEGQLAVTPDLEDTVIEPEPEVTEDEEQTAFRCLDCNKDFTNKGAYVRHMQSAVHKH